MMEDIPTKPMPRPVSCPDCGKPMPMDGPRWLCPNCLAANFFGAEGAESLSMDEPMREEGEMIGRYRLIEPIGEGGFGIVYRAEQALPFQRQVALKLIKPGLDSRMVVARFEAERQALSMLDHPNIARALDAGTSADGRPFFVMELVDGLPVNAFCARHRLTLEERLRLFLDICAGMEHAHAKGVIHRDLKPPNVMVSAGRDGLPPKVTIIDFGIAKALWQELTPRTLYTNPRHLLGTPEYMSPEQALHGGLDIDTRADVYSLGALLYEMITGQPPLGGGDLARVSLDEWVRVIRDVAPQRPSRRMALAQDAPDLGLLTMRAENELDWVVLKALEKERERRYQTVREFGEDVRCFLENRAVSARPPSIGYIARKYVSRHRGQMMAVAAAAATLVLGAVVSLRLALRAEQAEKQTRETFSQADAKAAAEKAEGQRYGESVALLCRALRMNPQNQEAGFRLLTLLAEAPVGVLAAPALLHGESVWQGRFVPPEGRQVITAASRNGTLTLWDWQPGAVREARSFVMPDPISAFALSADGRWAAAGSVSEKQCQARVWSVQDGALRGAPLELNPASKSLNRGPAEVFALAFAPDGETLYTASSDFVIRAWRLADAAVRWEVRCHAVPRCLAASSDGLRVAAGFDDTRLALYEAESGAVVRDAPVQRNRVERVQFSLDGKKVLVSGGDTFSTVLDAKTGQRHGDLQHFDRMHALAVESTGERVATGGQDSYVRLRTVKGAFIRSERVPDVVRELAFSADGLKLAVGTQEPQAVLDLLDGRTGTRLGAPLQLHRVVSDLSFHPGNVHVLVTCHAEDTFIMDIRPRQLRPRSLRIGEKTLDAGFLPDGSGVYALTDSGRLLRRDMQGAGADASLLPPGEKPAAFAFGPETGVVSGGLKLFVVDLAAWQVRHELTLDAPLDQARLTPQGRQVLTLDASRETLRVISTQTGVERTVLKREAGPVTAMTCDEDGQIIITGHENGVLLFHDTRSGLSRRVQTRTRSAILSLSLNAAATQAVSGSTDALMCLWDVKAGMEVPAAAGTPPRHADNGMFGGIKTLFSRDDSVFFSYNARDLRVRSFSADTGQPSGPYLTHSSSVSHIAQSPDGSLLLTAERDYQLFLWHLDQHLPAAAGQKIRGPLVAVHFSPNGRSVMAATRSGELQLLALPPTSGPPLPEAFLRFAEGFGRWRLNAENVLQMVGYEAFDAARAEVLALPDDPANPQLLWLKWLARDPAERPEWPE